MKRRTTPVISPVLLGLAMVITVGPLADASALWASVGADRVATLEVRHGDRQRASTTAARWLSHLTDSAKRLHGQPVVWTPPTRPMWMPTVWTPMAPPPERVAPVSPPLRRNLVNLPPPRA